MNARLVLNATGPWVDHLRKMEDPNAAPSIRLSKGAHLVLKRTSPWKAALATPIDKYRITFALPWEDMLLLGTTDEEFEGDPADVSVTEKDISQILDEAAFSVRDQQLSRDLITYSFAGLRVLPGGPGDTAKAKRETVVTEGRGGMLSVAGGKWTTFRHIGRTVMQKLEALPGAPLGDDFEPISSLPKKLPLPGVANPRAVAHRLLVDNPAPGPRMAADTAKHLATHYGSLAFDIARLANENPELGRARAPRRPRDLGAGRLRPGQRVGRDAGRRAAPSYDADDPGAGHGRGPREGPGPARQEVGGYGVKGAAPGVGAAPLACRISGGAGAGPGPIVRR